MNPNDMSLWRITPYVQAKRGQAKKRGRVLNLASFNRHLFMHKSCSGFTQIVIPASAGIQQLALHGLWIPASQPE